MRPILLAFIIVTAGVAKGIHNPHTVKTNNNYQVKKGDTAVQIARNNGITISELKSLNPKINLSQLALNTTLKISKKQHIVTPVLKQDIKEVTTVIHKKNNTVRHITSLPEIPTIKNDVLIHFEQVLPFEINSKPPMLIANKNQPAKRITINEMSIDRNNKLSESSPVTRVFSDKFQLANLNLLWPVETRTISSTWGPRIRTRVIKVKTHGRSRRPKLVVKHFIGNHKGVDFNAPRGNDIFAAMDGQVIFSGQQKAYGNFITIDHGNGVVTLYGHCDKNLVSSGETVYRGQKIAEVGSTGHSTGPHVHFELRLNGTAHNPLPFLNDTIIPNMIAKASSTKPYI